jgi:hypothetical protein
MGVREIRPLVLIDAVGLTGRLLPLAPRLSALAEAGWSRPLREVVPAVTCTAQASLLTGRAPELHGIVGNGWLFRETGEVRFWQQSNALIGAEPLYVTARRRAAERGRPFRAAKLFWWFNQGAAVEFSVTPKPHYGADGGKVFGIAGSPPGLTGRLEATLGPFPFHTFWGPSAGLACTPWIARCAAEVLAAERPELTLVYLPHLDYDPQRLGPSGCDWPRLVGELDAACAPLLDAARRVGARVWVVSEYGHGDVARPVHLNRILRRAGLLAGPPRPVRRGPGHLRQPRLRRLRPPGGPRLRPPILATATGSATCSGESGGGPVLLGEGTSGGSGSTIPRSGELVVLSEPDAWFAYPFWLDDRVAPDYARTVDIHRKPGTTPASCSSTRAGLAQGEGAAPARPEEARVPDALRRGPARPGAGAGQPRPARLPGRGPARAHRRRPRPGRGHRGGADRGPRLLLAALVPE